MLPVCNIRRSPLAAGRLHHITAICCAKLELSPFGFASATHVFILPHALIIIKVDALPTATCVGAAYADKAYIGSLSLAHTPGHVHAQSTKADPYCGACMQELHGNVWFPAVPLKH